MTKGRTPRLAFVAVVTAFFMAFAGIALADGIQGDTDALSTSSPAANGLDANQTAGTTVQYDYSAHIKDTGNVNNNVFAASGDTVTAFVTVVDQPVGWTTSVSKQFTGADAFTAYDQNRAGELSVTVPSGATAGDVGHVKVEITATASNGESLSPGKVVLNYNITVDAAQGCTYTATFRAPLDQSTPANFIGNVFKKGRVLPVKANVYCNGVEITPSNSTLVPSVVSGSSSFVAKATDAVETFSDAGSSAGGTTDMRWSTDGFWLYNYDTSKLLLGTTHQINIKIDGTVIQSTYVLLNPTK